MYSKQLQVESLRQQNFQLKNEITDLKNGFDLNRDVLKIMQEQIKQKDMNRLIFYQVISRLTGINNTVMITNIELVQQRNKLNLEKKKLENTIDKLNERIHYLTEFTQKSSNPREIQLELREESKNLHREIMAMNQDILLKSLEIDRLKKKLQHKEICEQKKPLISSDSRVPAISLNESQQKMESEPVSTRKFQNNDILKYKVIAHSLQRENQELKRLIEELEYRLTLLARIYEIEPEDLEARRQREEQRENTAKKINENQLALLMFALQNTQLVEDSCEESIRLTIRKKSQWLQSPESRLKHHKSCFSLMY